MAKAAIYLCFLLFSSFVVYNDMQLPISSGKSKLHETMALTTIGEFGLQRKPRKKIPAHLHTGIDIRRPSCNYVNEPVFPIAKGTVISVRRDGPYAQIIIEHLNGNDKFWTLYEHIAGIRVKNGDAVSPHASFARFMTKNELVKYGWQFDHLHFEILKTGPMKIIPSTSQPERLYSAYTLLCTTKKELAKYYYNPMEFLNLPHE